jgi:hypothetical protein
MVGITDPCTCCTEPPDLIDPCIRIIIYQFLCCEVRAFLHVASPCLITEIRINGTVVANPGTYEFGGHPASAPTIMIGDEEVTGTVLAVTGAECCPSLNPPDTTTSYVISVAAPDCIYLVEVDTCDTTYSCSLSYCLPRQILIEGQSLGPYSNSDTCSIETELGTSTRTITNDIGAISIPELSIDFCTDNEDGVEYSLGSWLATTTNETTIGLVTNTQTVEYDGTLTLWIPPYNRCEFTGGSTNITLQFLFTGTRTTTSVDSLGTYVSVYDAVNLLVGGIIIYNCNDSIDTFAGLIFCNQLRPPTIPDALACECGGTIGFTMISSWC